MNSTDCYSPQRMAGVCVWWGCTWQGGNTWQGGMCGRGCVRGRGACMAGGVHGRGVCGWVSVWIRCKQDPVYLPEEDEGAFGSLDELVDRAQLPLVLRVEVLRRVDDEEQRGVEDVDRPAVQVPRLHHQLLVRCREENSFKFIPA